MLSSSKEEMVQLDVDSDGNEFIKIKIIQIKSCHYFNYPYFAGISSC